MAPLLLSYPGIMNIKLIAVTVSVYAVHDEIHKRITLAVFQFLVILLCAKGQRQPCRSVRPIPAGVFIGSLRKG